MTPYFNQITQKQKKDKIKQNRRKRRKRRRRGDDGVKALVRKSQKVLHLIKWNDLPGESVTHERTSIRQDKQG